MTLPKKPTPPSEFITECRTVDISCQFLSEVLKEVDRLGIDYKELIFKYGDFGRMELQYMYSGPNKNYHNEVKHYERDMKFYEKALKAVAKEAEKALQGLKNK